jgi:hypothetical protein
MTVVTWTTRIHSSLKTSICGVETARNFTVLRLLFPGCPISELLLDVTSKFTAGRPIVDGQEAGVSKGWQNEIVRA